MVAVRARANYIEIAKWAKTARIDEHSTVLLVLESPLDDEAPIAEWDHDAISSAASKENREAWAQELVEIAQDDANLRSAKQTAYKIRRESTNDGRALEKRITLRRVGVNDDDREEAKQGADLDGSTRSIIVQQQRMIESMGKQQAEMVKMAMEHQRGTLAVLDQSYRFIAKLMGKSESLHEKITERDEETLRAAIKEANAGGSKKKGDGDAFDDMIDMVKDKVGDKIAGQVEQMVVRALMSGAETAAKPEGAKAP